MGLLALHDVLGLENRLPDRADLRLWIEASGLLGPVLVVGLMTVAIVASPIPSAPIALAAGAAYGHTFGTILVVLGAETWSHDRVPARARIGSPRSLRGILDKN